MLVQLPTLVKVIDLKGKTIGVTDMASPDKNFFSIMLQRHGIDPVSDVEWRLYPADLLGIALQKGEIQAASGSDLFMFRLIKTGNFISLATNLSEEYANISCCVVGITAKLIEQNKPLAAAITQAVIESYLWAAEHHDRSTA